MCGGHFNPLFSALALPNTLTAVHEPDQKSIRQTGITCWHCNSAVSTDFTWCPLCGAALKPTSCSYCGRIVGIREEYCPYCGAPQRVETPR